MRIATCWWSAPVRPGLAAALAASETRRAGHAGRRAGGDGRRLLHDVTSTIDGKAAWDWLAEAIAELGRRGNVTLLPRTTAFGYYNHNHVGLAQRLTDHLADPHADLPRERLWQVRAREVVLATGALERPLVFAGNDRPGIMLADALRAYVNRYGVRARPARGDRDVRRLGLYGALPI